MKKRWISAVLTSAMILSLAGCGAQGEQEQERQPGQAQEETETMQENTEQDASNGDQNVLVAYFSWADNAVLAEDVDAVASPSVIPPGNVQQLAGWVQEETGGDLFSIRVTDPYPSDWDECLERANEERAEEARPELVENVENIDQYDTVFLGYPNWWADLPMPLYTFFEEYDFSGKTIIPFNSHNGSRFSNTISTIQELEPEATVIEDGFTINERQVPDAAGDIADWLDEIGY